MGLLPRLTHYRHLRGAAGHSAFRIEVQKSVFFWESFGAIDNRAVPFITVSILPQVWRMSRSGSARSHQQVGGLSRFRALPIKIRAAGTLLRAGPAALVRGPTSASHSASSPAFYQVLAANSKLLPGRISGDTSARRAELRRLAVPLSVDMVKRHPLA